MPRGWKQQELWRSKAYTMWKGMWRRVSNPKMKYWCNCEIWEDFKFFSNFLYWLESEPKFEEFCSTCGDIKWCIDKDMKDPNNRNYFPECMTLTTQSHNCKDVLNRVGNPSSNNKRPIMGISLKDGSIITFDSIQEAQNNGFNKGNIASCLNGSRISHGGYQWFYLDE